MRTAGVETGGALTVKAERTLAQPYDQVFDALLLTLTELGFKLVVCDREEGHIAASPGERRPAGGALLIQLSRTSGAETRVGVQSAVTRFSGVGHIAQHERAIRRLFAALQQRWRGQALPRSASAAASAAAATGRKGE